MQSRLEQLQAMDQGGRKLGEVLARFLLQNQDEILSLYPGPVEDWSDEQMAQAFLWCTKLLEQELHPLTLDFFRKTDSEVLEVLVDEKA